MKIIFFVLLIFWSNLTLFSKEIVVMGRILNKENSEPINAANVKAIEQGRRVYSTSKGLFKLPLTVAKSTIQISALGYNSDSISIDKNYSGDTLLVFLTSNPIISGEAIAIGDITPTELVKRAIQKKKENLARIKTLQAVIYSKLFFDFDGFALNSSKSNTKSVSVSGGLFDKGGSPTTFLMETFSAKYVDIEKGIDYTKILQRRQTANIEANQNIISFSQFINLYDESIDIFDVSIPTPLSEKAYEYYKFFIDSKTKSDDKLIYNLSFRPINSISPGFIGTISLVEGSYEMIEADIKPSPETAITFVDSLHYMQKFTKLNDEVWYPTYLEIDFVARMEIIKGLAEVNMKAKAISIVNEVEINRPLPDSVYKYKSDKVVRIDTEADSLKHDFWNRKSIIPLSEFERDVYREVDSIMAESAKDPLYNSPFKFDLTPYLNFNRVESIAAGISPEIIFLGVPITGKMFYSWGLKEFYGDFEISKKGRIAETVDFEFSLGAFSNIDRLSFDRSYEMLSNTLSAAFLHFDYYDYYYKSGFKTNVSAKYFDYFKISLGYESSRQSSLNKTTDRAVFCDCIWRDNPQVIDDAFELIFSQLKLGNLKSNQISGDFAAEIDIRPFSGAGSVLFGNFKGVLATGSIRLPLFETGYKPISIELIGKFGISDNNLPPQYQFRMHSALSIYGKNDVFFSANPGEYGGMSFWELHAEFKLSDYLWREFGLPLIDKRGLEFSIFTSFAKYYAQNSPIIYSATEEKYYAEAGFGFFRLPTFVSNVIYWNANFRFGIGELAAGRFGWSLGLELPF